MLTVWCHWCAQVGWLQMCELWQGSHDWSKDCDTCSLYGAKRYGEHKWNGCKMRNLWQQCDDRHKWGGHVSARSCASFGMKHTSLMGGVAAPDASQGSWDGCTGHDCVRGL